MKHIGKPYSRFLMPFLIYGGVMMSEVMVTGAYAYGVKSTDTAAHNSHVSTLNHGTPNHGDASFTNAGGFDSGFQAMEQNPDIEAQMKGRYPALNRQNLHNGQESYPLGAIQKAWNRPDDNGAGVYRVIYRPHEVIKVRIREFMTSTLVFPQWESIGDIIVGDPSSYGVKSIQPHVVTITSKDNIGVDSSITLIGKSGRVYTFYVRTEGYNSRHIPDVAVYIKVPYSGPDPQKPLTTESSPDDYLEDAYFDPSKISFAFDMAGDESIAPERVYSDGIRTWFDFGERIREQSLPTIYHIDDGVDTPVNVARDVKGNRHGKSQQGTKIVAQAAGSFALKHGQKRVCVYPSADSPLPKGTK